MSILRVLVTGSRSWTDRETIVQALRDAGQAAGVHPQGTVVVHGAASGADTLAAEVAREFGCMVQAYPARDFADPKARNLHMVGLGADVCLAFATSWASGTGHCARAARRAGIPTVDKGVDTRIEARP